MHKVAIIPDIEIKPIIKVIQEGKDEVYDSAVNLFKLENKKHFSYF